jgi:hypothetical protein
MKKLLLVLMLLAAVAISGCTDKSPSGTSSSGAEKSVGELKTLAVKSAEGLNSYSLKSSASQTLVLNAVGTNDTPENATTVKQSVETLASVNLSGFEAGASGSTTNEILLPGKPANSSTTQANVYQIGNSTYVKGEDGKWTHLQDPRTAEEIWGQGDNNQVRALANTFNVSQAEIVGSESIEGVDTYKLKVITGNAESESLYNAAFSIAAQLTQYPMLMPSINRSELNATGSIEKLVWISKENYLPVKYQSSMAFEMTPEIIAGLDPNTGEMKMFNQSVRLGKISAVIDTSDIYYDFNKQAKITPPAEALEAPAVTPTSATSSAATSAATPA